MHIYDYANKAGVGRFHPHINVLIQFEHNLAPEQYSICMKLILKNDSALKITSMYWWHDDVIWWVVLDIKGALLKALYLLKYISDEVQILQRAKEGSVLDENWHHVMMKSWSD